MLRESADGHVTEMCVLTGWKAEGHLDTCSDVIGKYLITPFGAQLLVSVKTAESKAQQFLTRSSPHVACSHIFIIFATHEASGSKLSKRFLHEASVVCSCRMHLEKLWEPQFYFSMLPKLTSNILCLPIGCAGKSSCEKQTADCCTTLVHCHVSGHRLGLLLICLQ